MVPDSLDDYDREMPVRQENRLAVCKDLSILNKSGIGMRTSIRVSMPKLNGRSQNMTAGELRVMLENIPDDLTVVLHKDKYGTAEEAQVLTQGQWGSETSNFEPDETLNDSAVMDALLIS